MACYRRGEINEAASYFVRGIHAFRNFPQEGPEYATFWAEASNLFGALGPGPTPFQVKTDPDRAMFELRRAVAAGNVDLEGLKKDSSLDPLRSRPDFRALVDRGAAAARPDETARGAVQAGSPGLPVTGFLFRPGPVRRQHDARGEGALGRSCRSGSRSSGRTGWTSRPAPSG